MTAVALLFALSLGVGEPQAPAIPEPRSAPPVLSTVPTPPAGVVTEPAQMSGVPLQVGDLPPGIVVVRVVRQSFQTNLPGQTVALHEDDSPGATTATTGADGRAQFSGLRVGDYVQVRATVGTERLESQRFQLPAAAGIRLVLVAGVGAPTASGPDWPTPVGGATPAVSMAIPSGTSSDGNGNTTAIIGGCLAIATLLMLGFILGPRLRRRHAPAALAGPRIGTLSMPDPVVRAAAPQSTREQLFERLVALEHDRAAGHVSEPVFTAMRNRLIDDIAVIDLRASETEGPRP